MLPRSLARSADGEDLFHVNLGRVIPGVAGGAVSRFLAVSASLLQTFNRKISQRVGSDELSNFLDRLIGGDQLFLGGSIDSVKAGRDGGRTRDSHVHFFRPGIANHADDLAAGGAAHDRVVYEDNAFALEQAVNGVELQLHAEIAHRLLRFDKGASDLVVADESKTKRNAAFGRVSDGGGVPRIGHGNHDIRVNRSLAGKLASHIIATQIHRAAEDNAVRTRKINVFKNAAGKRRRRRIKSRADSLRPDDNKFTGLDIAFVDRADQIESASFRSKDHRIFFLTCKSRDAAHGKRPKSARIAGRKDAITANHDERKRAFNAA